MDLQERFADNRMDTNMLVECLCGDSEHQMVWSMDTQMTDYDWLEDFPPEMYISMYLANHRGFFKRAWQAIKYIFGYKSRFGAFDCIALTFKDADKLIEFLEGYKRECERWYLNKKQLTLWGDEGEKEIRRQSNRAKREGK